VSDHLEGVPFWEAFRFWLKLGFISFGGPAGQIAIMHKELVERRSWISEKHFLHALNYCMAIPGPEAQQLATYIGWLMHKTAGGIAAGALFVLPSLVLLIGLSWLYAAFGHLTQVQGLFSGIKPAVMALVFAALYRIGSRTLRHPLLWGLAALSFAAVFFFSLPFPLVIAAAAGLGFLGGRLIPGAFLVPEAKAGQTAAPPSTLDGPAPEHVRFRWSRTLRYAAIGLLLWLVPLAALFLTFGWQGTLTQMAWFFTQAALVTFGGAYAVLPFVFQGAVSTYGWITPSQMIDGLALGETTPGPLIIVVSFIGFLGAWSHQIFGPNALVLAGVAGALVVTWFTFLPSFLFVLIGGPLIEATQGDLRWSAPLTAITAAVVGVMLSLALFFATHVLWPSGLGGPFRLPSALLALAAAVALLVFRRSAVEVIGGSAAVGLALF
jgi:chromate transporter